MKKKLASTKWNLISLVLLSLVVLAQFWCAYVLYTYYRYGGLFKSAAEAGTNTMAAGDIVYLLGCLVLIGVAMMSAYHVLKLFKVTMHQVLKPDMTE
jgi:hypothetical protein